MPRYFTHLYNSEVLCDERGEEFADLDEALAGARRAASELIAEQIVEDAKVDLNHRLEVMDDEGKAVIVLKFADLFKAGEAPAPTAAPAVIIR